MTANCSAKTLARFPEKDPGERLDYLFDFTALLGTTEQITTHAVTVDPSGEITVDASSIVSGGKKVQAIMSGGTAGREYIITVNGQTDQGGPPTRIFERSAILAIRDL